MSGRVVRGWLGVWAFRAFDLQVNIAVAIRSVSLCPFRAHLPEPQPDDMKKCGPPFGAGVVVVVVVFD